MGMNIKNHRSRLRYSQFELAEHIGISQSMLQKMEAGLNSANIEAVVGLAKVFQISVDELVGLKGPKSDVDLVSEFGEALQVIRRFATQFELRGPTEQRLMVSLAYGEALGPPLRRSNGKRSGST